MKPMTSAPVSQILPMVYAKGTMSLVSDGSNGQGLKPHTLIKISASLGIKFVFLWP